MSDPLADVYTKAFDAVFKDAMSSDYRVLLNGWVDNVCAECDGIAPNDDCLCSSCRS